METGQHTPRVTVTTDQPTYHRDESIYVTIHNGLSAVIYTVPGQPDGSLLALERQEGTRWLPQETSPPTRPAFVIAIAPKSDLQGVLNPAVPEQGDTARPLVSEPTEPGVGPKDLRTLPPAEPWKPGDPIREIPNRRPPAREQQPDISSTTSTFDSGTYRLVFRFRAGATQGPVHLSYSSLFVVTD